MTIDEAIKIYEIGAKRTWNGRLTIYAEQCQQMAEWLKDYKRLLEQEPCEVSQGLVKDSQGFSQEPCEDSISRQAVMNCYKKWQPYMATRLFDFENELSSLPSVTPQPCEDCISREETLKALMDEWTDFDSELMDYLIEKVKKLPSVTPQPKMGRWVKTIGENGVTSAVRCSECGFEDNRYELFDYCPVCGAKMQEVEE